MVGARATGVQRRRQQGEVGQCAGYVLDYAYSRIKSGALIP
jgi:hypothetical protein